MSSAKVGSSPFPVPFASEATLEQISRHFGNAFSRPLGSVDHGSSSNAIPFTVLVLIATALGFVLFSGAPTGLKAPKGNKARRINSLIPSLGQVGFYGKSRPDWIARHMGDIHHPSQLEPLRLNLRQNVVTLVHGPKSGQSFFSNRDLNFQKGFAVLFAGISVPDRQPDDSADDVDVNERSVSIDQPAPRHEGLYNQWQNKHLRACLSNQRLKEHNVMEKIALDIYHGFEDIWQADKKGNKAAVTGLIDMPKQLYSIMLRVSVRVVGTTELADSQTLLEPVMQHYWDMETLNSFSNTLLPNLPTASNRRRKQAGRELHRLILTPIMERISSGRQEQDYVQTMIESGASASDIAIWVTGFLFASIINTSSVFAWTLAMTSADAPVYKRMRDEIDETLARLSTINGVAADASVLDKCLALSIEQLEENFNFTYFCIREVIRLVANDMLYRRMETRKAGATGTVGGETIRDGEFLAFMSGTVNLSAEIYKDPTRFDPTRWERNEGSGPYEFLGWGAGLHPCIGMKLAKNELKLAIAMFVSLMDVVPVDGAGKRQFDADSLPAPVPFQGGYRPPSAPLLLRYTMRM